MKLKIAYWIVLGLFLLMMTAAGVGYLSGNQQMADGFRHLGYPDYFRTMLGVAKLLGVLALLVPGLPIPVREWAYAGFGITLIAAVVSHLASGEPGRIFGPLFALALLISARFLWRERFRFGPAAK